MESGFFRGPPTLLLKPDGTDGQFVLDQVVSFPTSGSVSSDGILIALSNREGKSVKIVRPCGLMACRDFVDSSSVAGNLLQYVKQGHLSPKHAFFMEKYGIFEKKQHTPFRSGKLSHTWDPASGTVGRKANHR